MLAVTSHGVAMTPAFPNPLPRGSSPHRAASHPVSITCLQWDCDGALNDPSREWLLQNLAAHDRFAVELMPQGGRGMGAS
jgi:hypothetical protein